MFGGVIVCVKCGGGRVRGVWCLRGGEFELLRIGAPAERQRGAFGSVEVRNVVVVRSYDCGYVNGCDSVMLVLELWTCDPVVVNAVSEECDKSCGSVVFVSKLWKCYPCVADVVLDEWGKRYGSVMSVSKLWMYDPGVVGVVSDEWDNRYVMFLSKLRMCDPGIVSVVSEGCDSSNGSVMSES